MRFMLDTSTCVDILRGRRDVIRRLRAIPPDEAGISVITSYELFAGVEACASPDRERRKVELLLDTIHELPLLPEGARQAARVRAELAAEGRPIGPYDLLLAGHALASGLVLVTSDVGEFSRVRGLEVEGWRSRG